MSSRTVTHRTAQQRAVARRHAQRKRDTDAVVVAILTVIASLLSFYDLMLLAAASR